MTDPAGLPIGFVIGSLAGGGAERQVVEIVRHLNRQQFAPHVLLAYRTGELLSELPADIPVGAYREKPQPRDVWLARARLSWWLRCRFLAREIRIRRLSLVYSRTFLASRDADRACRWTSTPHVIACVADPETELSLHGGWRRPGLRGQAAAMYRRAAMILTNSAGLKQRLEATFELSPDQVLVQPNVFDFERIDRAAAQPLQLPAGRQHLVTVGRIDANKGHHDALLALAEVHRRQPGLEWTWHVLGQGPLLNLLRQKANELGLAERVVFPGYVANPFPYYRAAGVLLLPSHSEGSPNVLVEALACGLPAIATDCPSGPREILDHGRRGTLVPVADVGALAQAIAALLESPEAHREQAIVAQREVRAAWSLPVVMATLQERLLVLGNNRCG